MAFDEDRRRSFTKIWKASTRIVRLANTVTISALDYTITKYDSQFNKSNQSRIEEEINTKKQELKFFASEQERDTITQLTTQDAAVREEMTKRIAQTRQKIDIASALISRLALQNPEGKIENCHKRCAERLRDMCAANKGVYIKLGQHLAMLDHVLPQEYCTALSTLLGQTPISAWADVQQVIREDLGAEAQVLFDSIESQPIASASLAQVHVAYKDGKKLAVKVQHFGLREESVYDAKAITAAVDFLGWLFEGFKYQWLTREMNINLPQELDFRIEAKNLKRTTNNFKHLIASGDLAIPAVNETMTSARVLTMDFEEGAYISDVEKMHSLGINPADVAKLVSSVFCEQIYKFGFVHCDPHPANMLVRQHPWKPGKPTIVLLDHGLYKDLKNWFRLEYCRLWSGIILGDRDQIKRSCENMNVGPAYTLLAAMLTMRPWDDIVNTDRERLKSTNTKADSEMLKVYAEKYFKDIVNLLGRVDSDMLLLLKTNDCLRHLDNKLGSPVNTSKIVARITGDVLVCEDLWPSDTTHDRSIAETQAKSGEHEKEVFNEIYMKEKESGRLDYPVDNRPSGVMFWFHPRTQQALWRYCAMQTRVGALHVLEWWLWFRGK